MAKVFLERAKGEREFQTVFLIETVLEKLWFRHKLKYQNISNSILSRW